jgi:hypothetical protein
MLAAALLLGAAMAAAQVAPQSASQPTSQRDCAECPELVQIAPGCWHFVGSERLLDESRSWRDAKIDQTGSRAKPRGSMSCAPARALRTGSACTVCSAMPTSGSPTAGTTRTRVRPPISPRV